MPSKVNNKKPQSKSLAFLKFGLRHVNELRSFWFHQVMTQYGLRWLQEHETEIPGKITCFPGDDKTPFVNLGATPSEILSLESKHSQMLVHSAIVRLVTVFENYLYDCIQRTVFIEPKVLEKSEIKLSASEVASAIESQGIKAWFAHYVADKLCRSSAPKELITRVDGFLQAGMIAPLEAEIKEWVQWTLVRNSIAHLGGDISVELANAWKHRFPNPGTPILLHYSDVLRLAFISRTLAKRLDSGQRAKSFRVYDRNLLAHELFVRNGIDDPRQLSVEVSSILSVPLSKTHAEQLLKSFRQGAFVDEGITITEEMLAI